MFQRYFQEHRDLVRLSGAIVAAARGPTAESLRELSSLRLALARQLSAHIAAEAEMIGARGDPMTDPLVRQYHDGFLAWQRALFRCNARWPIKAVADTPAHFLVEYLSLHLQLERRVQWEEHTLYPAVFPEAKRALTAYHQSGS